MPFQIRDTQSLVSSTINQIRQAEQAQQAQEAKALAPGGDASGIRGIVKMARVLDAPVQHFDEPVPSSKVGNFFKGVFDKICSIGRAISNFFCSSSKALPAPDARMAGAQAPNLSPAANQANTALLGQLMTGANLPDNFQRLAESALRFVQNTLNSFVPINGTTLKDNPELCKAVCAKIQNSAVEFSAGQLRTTIVDCAIAQAKHAAMKQSLMAELQKSGHTSSIPMDDLVKMMATQHPTLKTAMSNPLATDGAAINKMMTSLSGSVKEFVDFVKTKDNMAANATNTIATEYAKHLGITPEQAKAKIDISMFKNTVDALALNVKYGDNMSSVKNVINEYIENFIDDKVAPDVARYKTIDALNVSDKLKNFFKHEAFANPHLPNSTTVFADCVQAVKYTQDNPAMQKLQTLLAANPPPDAGAFKTALTNVLASIANDVGKHFTSDVFDGKFNASQRASLISYGTMVFLEQNPSINALLHSNRDVVESIRQETLRNVDEHQANSHYTDILLTIEASNPKYANTVESMHADIRKADSLSIPHAAAFTQAKADVCKAFPDLNLSAQDFKAIESKIENPRWNPLQGADASPDKLAAAAREVVTKAIIPATIGRLIDTTGLNAENARNVRDALLSRHAEINDMTSSAQIKTKLKALTVEIQELVATYKNIQTAEANAKTALIAELATDSGKSVQEVRTQLEKGPLAPGGSFDQHAAALRRYPIDTGKLPTAEGIAEMSKYAAQLVQAEARALLGIA